MSKKLESPWSVPVIRFSWALWTRSLPGDVEARSILVFCSSDMSPDNTTERYMVIRDLQYSPPCGFLTHRTAEDKIEPDTLYLIFLSF